MLVPQVASLEVILVGTARLGALPLPVFQIDGLVAVGAAHAALAKQSVKDVGVACSRMGPSGGVNSTPLRCRKGPREGSGFESLQDRPQRGSLCWAKIFTDSYENWEKVNVKASNF